MAQNDFTLEVGGGDLCGGKTSEIWNMAEEGPAGNSEHHIICYLRR